MKKKTRLSRAPPPSSHWRCSSSSCLRLPIPPAPTIRRGGRNRGIVEGTLSSVYIGDHPVSWLYVSGPSSDLRLVFRLLDYGDLVTKEPLSQELG